MMENQQLPPEEPEQASPMAGSPPQQPPANPILKEGPQTEKSLAGDAKYTVDNPGHILTQDIGDKHFNFYGPDPEQIRDMLKNELSSIFPKQATQSGNKLSSVRNSFIIKVPETIPEEAQEQAEIPKTEEGIAHWYSQLDSYSQCFVQAMALFAGTTIHAVSSATTTLYKPVAEANRAIARSILSLHQTEYMPKAEPLPSLIELKKRVYVITERVNMEECLWWQDTDSTGSSQFQIRLLSFLAKSSPLWPDSPFLDQLESWVKNLTDNNASLALRAQGVIWWHYIGRLRREVMFWSNHEEWYRAAYLLYGAYEVDRFHNPKNVDDPHTSFVLQCTRRWVKTARKKANGKKGCAAALTYMQIGLHNLDIALQGLDSLLELPKTHTLPGKEETTDDDDDDDDDNNEWDYALSEDTYAGVVKGYYELALAGYTQEILQHLALHVENTSHYRIAMTHMKYDERESRRLQRSLTLIATFDVFFRLAQHSLHTINYRPWVNYDLTLPLPSLLNLSNTDGRETLLVGILNGPWNASLRSLICSAIIENIGDYRHVAFNLLHKWAELVLKDQSPHPDQVRLHYVQFLVEIGKMTQSWGAYWHALGIPSSNAFTHYKRHFLLWERQVKQRDQPLISALVQEVLDQMPQETQC